ncbi:MAG: WbqC family protein [Candidatus Omnitrophota bacterium]
MIISIMQPGYLPWLGFFELMYNCDLFVLLDDVQYTKRDWRNRNRIRTKDGWIWLTVPVWSKNKQLQLINEAKINPYNDWRENHLKALEINYYRARYFSEYFPYFKKLYASNWEYLLDLDIEIINWIAKALDIKTPIMKSSSLNAEGIKEKKIINICKKLDATELYDSKAAQDILDLNKLNEEKIKIKFQDYQHPIYKQVYEPFIPYMSAIDLLFQYGPESLNILMHKS